MINEVQQGKVSLDRIQKFLCSEEVDAQYITHTKDSTKPVALEITNGNFYWTDKSGKKKDPQNAEEESKILYFWCKLIKLRRIYKG